MAGEWQRGGAVKHIGEILRRLSAEVAPASAARSQDASVERVRSFLATRLDRLAELEPFAAVDRLLVVAGFADRSRNQRLSWARLWAQRLGADAPAALAALLADIVADGSAASAGACLGHRLRLIAEGRAAQAWGREAPRELVAAVQHAFGARKI